METLLTIRTTRADYVYIANQEDANLSIKVFPPMMKGFRKEGIVGYFLENGKSLPLKEYIEHDNWKGELIFDNVL